MNTYKDVLLSKEFKFEQFKLQWMIDHNFTLLDLIKSLEVLSENYPYASLMELFEEWESDRGFWGMIWPNYDEWLETEGKEVK